MKKVFASFALCLALCMVLTLAACKKKKPDVPPPPPTITTPQTETPVEPPAKPAPSNPPTTSQPGTSAKTTPKPAKTSSNRSHPAPKKNTVVDKPAPEAAKAVPPKIAIQETGTTPTASSTPLAPGVPHDEEAHARASTEQLLQGAEANLNSITRLLTSDEQSLKTQIIDYMNQSRQAVKDGDAVRARNLALKAHLLSDALAKPR